MLMVRCSGPMLNRALSCLDGLGLVTRIALRVDEQLVQTLVTIADRPAIHFEHVAKLQPRFVVARFDEQQIRTQFAELRGSTPARRRVVAITCCR